MSTYQVSWSNKQEVIGLIPGETMKQVYSMYSAQILIPIKYDTKIYIACE